MVISLVDLRYFVSVYSEKNFAAAARREHVTPSAVSQGIRRLEASLGVPLVVHGKNSCQFTEQGVILARKAPDIFVLLESTCQEVKAGQPQLQVNIGASQSIAASLLPQCIEQLSKEFPGLVPRICLGPTTRVRHWVEEQVVEIGVALDDGAQMNVESKVVGTGQFVLVMAKSKSRVSLENKTPFLLTEDRPEVLAFKDAHRLHFKCEPRIFAVVEGWECLVQFAAAGLGCALVPDYVLFGKNLTGCMQVPCPFPLPKYKIRALFKNKRHLSPTASRFLSILTHRFEL
jgi:LysR family positive regulator for ilvC